MTIHALLIYLLCLLISIAIGYISAMPPQHPSLAYTSWYRYEFLDQFPIGYFTNEKKYGNSKKKTEMAGPGIPLSLLPKMSKDLKIIPTNKVKVIREGQEMILIMTDIYYKETWMDYSVVLFERILHNQKTLSILTEFLI